MPVPHRFTRNRMVGACPLAVVTAACVVAACGGGSSGGGSGGNGGNSTTPVNISGTVIGSYFGKAKVCLDANANGACDGGEASAVTDANGAFALTGPASGVVADIAPGATRLDPGTGATVPITARIVLRAPQEAPTVVSVHSTAVVSEMESAHLAFADATRKVAASLGVTSSQLLSDFNKETDPAVKSVLESASADGLRRIQLALAAAKPSDDVRSLLASATATLDKIANLVVIYLENRSFDNLYGLFPGANGVEAVLTNVSAYPQYDRDGVTVLKTLPPVWNAGSQAASWNSVTTIPGRPFLIHATPGGVPGLDPSVASVDLIHRFYTHQMQLDRSRNDQFAAWSDAGGLTMGYYDGSSMRLWALARQYALADNYFQAAFGGSFLNHFWLICACSPTWANPPASQVSVVDGSGTRLVVAGNSPSSALTGPAVYVGDGVVTPKLTDGKYYAVNTVQPPYQPSGTPPASGEDQRLADPTGGRSQDVPLPAQNVRTLGDTLTAKGVDWKWYAAGWNLALSDRKYINGSASPNLQPQHQPFNYISRFNPTTTAGAAERAAHLKDYQDLLADIRSGSLPPVAFYKPDGRLNQHPGLSDFPAADAHAADLVAQLQASPQWRNMVIVITYDEYGGFWDHVAPPRIDQWGPGTRVAALVISPFAKKGYVDSVPYDTTSIAQFITRRFGLDPLPGVRKSMGDLSNALDIRQ